MESLNVLVIEDSKRHQHQEAAVEQLEARGHKVTIAKDLLEAEILLEGIDPKRQGVSTFKKLFPLETAFDVVLTNRDLPSTKGLMGVLPRALERVLEEGIDYFVFVFALRAAARGVRYVAIVTDKTCDDDDIKRPALDTIGMNRIFNVNGARVISAHAPLTGFNVHKRGVMDWGWVLDYLVAD